MIAKRQFLKGSVVLFLMTAAVITLLMMAGYVGRAMAQGTPGAITPDDPVGDLGLLYGFIRTSNGTAAVGVSLILMVWGLRNLPFDAWRAWSKTKIGGYALVVGSSLMVYVGTALASGGVVTMQLMLNAGAAALLAGGGWEGLRDVLKSLTKAPPAGGAATMLVLLTVGTLACDSGCKGAQSAGQAVIDCTKADAGEITALIAEFSPLLSGDAPDWGRVEAIAESAGATIGGCALSKIVQDYLGSAKLPKVDYGWLAHDALEHFRQKIAGGSSFHTAQGDM